jgi:hypothetical protein
MIFTNVSRLGDFLLLWPVASWYYKETGDRIHWVLSDNFPLYHKIEKIIMLQDMTEKVSYVNVGTNAGDINDWKFNPADFGINGDYYNFGFFSHPSEYMPNFYAKRYDFGVDYEFIINLGDENDYKNKNEYNVWIDSSPYREEKGKLKKYVPSESIELKSDFLSDAKLSKYASNVYCTMGGFTVLMDMCDVKCKIFAPRSLIYTSIKNGEHMYYRNNHEYFEL